MDFYKKEVLEDIKTWAEEGNSADTLEETRERLQDPSYTDGITGNASGSYYCNAYKAQEAINESGVLFDSDFIDHVESLGCNVGDILNKGAEAVDVWARCAAVDMLTDEELAEVLASAGYPVKD